MQSIKWHSFTRIKEGAQVCGWPEGLTYNKLNKFRVYNLISLTYVYTYQIITTLMIMNRFTDPHKFFVALLYFPSYLPPPTLSQTLTWLCYYRLVGQLSKTLHECFGKVYALCFFKILVCLLSAWLYWQPFMRLIHYSFFYWRIMFHFITIPQLSLHGKEPCQ